ncbi:glycosyltransferase family 2 protein [Cognatishimia maritima]|uniref:Glycosyl transferase family 2 n=1 Tax=Cognatishimia maritima TaxID=870908 RepID=A0A1M5WFK7_9RHOB|nr:glycosyltransferase family 2 protein [Cognatishimia maritima]SHH86281.1 Glycosyl transferase family 2 [Cognatishimia maritima]
MTLVMTLLVRDEIDIIQQNLDFHFSQGIDHIVVIDNGSVDGTRDILADYAREAPVTVLDEPEQNYNQSLWMSNAAFLARDTLGATWVLNNDADEFWLSRTGDLKDQLAGQTADGLKCERYNMLFAYDQARPPTRWSERALYRVTTPQAVPVSELPLLTPLPCPYFYRKLPPKILCQTRGLQEITQGNHNARYAHKAAVVPSDIQIYHYPVRSEQQMQSKVENGGASYAANADFPMNMGWHWRRWYQMLHSRGIEAVMQDALPSQAQLQQDIAESRVTLDRTMIELLRS